MQSILTQQGTLVVVRPEDRYLMINLHSYCWELKENNNSNDFSVYDIYMPQHAQGPVTPHTIVTLPNTNGMQLLLCYDNEGVYVNTYGKVCNNYYIVVA